MSISTPDAHTLAMALNVLGVKTMMAFPCCFRFFRSRLLATEVGEATALACALSAFLSAFCGWIYAPIVAAMPVSIAFLFAQKGG